MNRKIELLKLKTDSYLVMAGFVKDDYPNLENELIQQVGTPCEVVYKDDGVVVCWDFDNEPYTTMEHVFTFVRYRLREGIKTKRALVRMSIVIDDKEIFITPSDVKRGYISIERKKQHE